MTKAFVLREPQLASCSVPAGWALQRVVRDGPHSGAMWGESPATCGLRAAAPDANAIHWLCCHNARGVSDEWVRHAPMQVLAGSSHLLRRLCDWCLCAAYFRYGCGTVEREGCLVTSVAARRLCMFVFSWSSTSYHTSGSTYAMSFTWYVLPMLLWRQKYNSCVCMGCRFGMYVQSIPPCACLCVCS